MIFKHLNVLHMNIPGLSDKARSERKQRNVVNIKFNLFAWILEATSLMLTAISPKNDFIFSFIMNINPPLIYFYGIEENRRATVEYFKTRIRVFEKKKEGNLLYILISGNLH